MNDTANGNSVTVTDSAGGQVVGGVALNGDADGNIVTIGGTSTASGVTGGQATGSAHGNAVVINGGTISNPDALQIDIVAGGYSQGAGEVSANRVTVNGGTLASLHYMAGGVAADASSASVHDNAVVINGGTIGTPVAGGIAGTSPGHPGTGVNGNAVTVTGGDLTGARLVAGSLYLGTTPDGFEGSSSIDNTVIVKGAPNFGDTVILGAAYAMAGHSGISIPYVALAGTGSTFQLWSKNVAAGNIGGFQQYDFFLPANTQADDTMLTLTNGQPTDMSDAGVGVAMQSGGNLLRDGDRVTLVRNRAGILAGGLQQTQLTGMQGISIDYHFEVTTDPDNVYATVTGAPAPGGGAPAPGTPGSGVQVDPQTKAPVEASAASLGTLTQGSELAGGQGFDAAAQAGANGGAFMAASGGHSRLESGSHVDANGFAGMFGAAKTVPALSGDATVGIFAEGGHGSFTTHNDFGAGDVTGSGIANYAGGGLLGRIDWGDKHHAGPYAGGLFHAGSMHQDWQFVDLVGAPYVSYGRTSGYVGGIALGGWLQPLDAFTRVDLSARLAVDHIGGGNASLAGDPYSFDGTTSVRTRLGAKFSRDLTRQFTGWAEAAWVHEYDGSASATVYGLSTPSPSLRGDTGEIGLGLDVTPTDKLPLTVGAGVHGFAGKQAGVAGTLKAIWRF